MELLKHSSRKILAMDAQVSSVSGGFKLKGKGGGDYCNEFHISQVFNNSKACEALQKEQALNRLAALFQTLFYKRENLEFPKSLRAQHGLDSPVGPQHSEKNEESVKC
jgi:hypothetical protein